LSEWRRRRRGGGDKDTGVEFSDEVTFDALLMIAILLIAPRSFLYHPTT